MQTPPSNFGLKRTFHPLPTRSIHLCNLAGLNPDKSAQLFAVAAPDKELRDILDVEGNGQSASKDTLGFCPVLSRESPSSETDTPGKPLNLPDH